MSEQLETWQEVLRKMDTSNDKLIVGRLLMREQRRMKEEEENQFNFTI